MSLLSLNEYRLLRVKTVMNRENVDVIVGSLPEHILYLLGFTILGATYQAKTQNYAIYSPVSERKLLVISPSDAPTALDFDPDIELVCHGGFHFDFTEPRDAFALNLTEKIKHRDASQAEALIDAISRACSKPCRIAIDELRTPFTTVEKVRKAFPYTDVVPAMAMFEEARSIKHPLEIVGIEEATGVAEYSLLDALGRAQIWNSEYDLGMDYRLECAKRNGHGYFCTCTIDRRTAFSDTRHRKDSVLKDGSVIRFDYGATKDFYRSDLARTVLVGTPDRSAEYEYRYLLDGLEAAEAMMKPGVLACEVFETAMKAVRKGIPGYQRHHCGHGIGLQIYDPLPIAATCRLPIQENMVFCIETPYYVIGKYGLQIEDTVAVTSDGVRRLAHTSNEIIRIL